MNTVRRKRLREEVSNLKKVKSRIESIAEEEEEMRDNIPESFQDTDRFQLSEECSDALDDAIEHLDVAVTSIEEIL